MREIARTRHWEGRIAAVETITVRFDDGHEAEREVIRHPGSVGIVAHDGERLVLVSQPREPVGAEALLEIPAGKLDVVGEPPLETAKRELAEECGLAARSWEPLGAYWPSPGFTDERIHLFLATDLFETEGQPDEGERIEVVHHPLADLDALIDRVEDGKTLVGLLQLRRRM